MLLLFSATTTVGGEGLLGDGYGLTAVGVGGTGVGDGNGVEVGGGGTVGARDGVVVEVGTGRVGVGG